jgi:hypothetical protein
MISETFQANRGGRMRSFSNVSKLTGLILIVALLLVGGFSQSSVLAGVPAQTATPDAAGADAVATTSADSGAAATTAAGMTYPPCPPTGNATVNAAPTESASAATVDAAATTSAVPTEAATVNANPGYLGVRAEQVDDCGVLIVEVVTGGPADTAKLQPDDVVVALDGVATPAIALLRQGIQAKQPGTKVVLTLQRAGAQMDIEVTLGVRPPDTTGTVESAPQGEATAAATQ